MEQLQGDVVTLLTVGECYWKVESALLPISTAATLLNGITENKHSRV